MAINGQVSINISSAGDTIVIPAQQGVPIAVQSMIISLDTETTVQFKSGSTAFSGPQPILAMLLDPQPGRPWYVTANGQAFVISLGGAVPCGGTVWYSYGT